MDKEKVQPVDLRMSIVKPLGAKWMMGLYDYMKSKADIIKNGYRTYWHFTGVKCEERPLGARASISLHLEGALRCTRLQISQLDPS